MLDLILDIVYVVITAAACILLICTYMDHLEMQRFLKTSMRNSIANSKKWVELEKQTANPLD